MKKSKQKRTVVFLTVLVSVVLLLTIFMLDKKVPEQNTVVYDRAPEQVEISEKTKNLLSNQDQLNILVNQDNLEGCADLDLPHFRESCEANILANRASTKADKSLCGSASSSTVKSQCEMLTSTRL